MHVSASVAALDEHLKVVRRTLAEAEATAGRWHRQHGDDRQGELQQAIEALQQSRQPLSAYVRRLPRTGRHSNPVFALNRDVDATIRRLRSMLRPSSGTPRMAAPIEHTANLNGSLARTKQVIGDVRREHAGLRRVLATGTERRARSGHIIRSVADLNAEASRLLVQLDRARQSLNTHWRRYVEGYPQRVERESRRQDGNPHRVRDAYDDMHARVVNLREVARELRREVSRSARQEVPEAVEPVPGRQPYERWTADDMAAAYIAFHKQHGRYPAKAEHGRDGMPGYTQVRRTVGGKQALVDYVTEVTNR